MENITMRCGRCPACEQGRSGCVLDAYIGAEGSPRLTERQVGALRILSAAGLLSSTPEPLPLAA